MSKVSLIVQRGHYRILGVWDEKPIGFSRGSVNFVAHASNKEKGQASLPHNPSFIELNS